MVMKDLEITLKELTDSGASPVKVRRAFTRYITESQKLTEVMRKEYSEKVKEKWNAKDFPGWNDITLLFKELRKYDYHDSPVTIIIEETGYFLVSETEYSDGTIEKGYAVSSAKYDIGNPFSEKSIPNSRLVFYDENMRELPDEGPERVEFKYYVNPCNKKIERLLVDIGDTDVILLCKQCNETLSDYCKYYLKMIKLNK